MKSKLVVGAGDFLEVAFQAWKAQLPDMEVQKLAVSQDASHTFDFSFLDLYSPEQTSVFAAFDNRFLNFKRLELMGAIKARGFRMDAFVGAGAIIGPDAKMGENAFISEGAVIGTAARLQYNVFIGQRAVVGYAAEIGQSAWIEAAVVVGRKARVGAQTLVGAGVILADEVEFGRCCVINKPGIYRENIAAKTFFLQKFEMPIRIFN